MLRKIIKIDEEKCTGCGICAMACHEGAIKIIDGKAKLTREDYCDGMGDCLPSCPAGAISFEEREAPSYNAEAVKASKAGVCPGEKIRDLNSGKSDACGELRQWPCQIKLLPLRAPYYNGADLLIAADCTAYTRSDFHEKYMRGRVTVIGCSKLDGVDYSEKLTAILSANDIKSVTVLRMEVPCCGGIELAARKAIAASGKQLPLEVVTLSVDGHILAAK